MRFSVHNLVAFNIFVRRECFSRAKSTFIIKVGARKVTIRGCDMDMESVRISEIAVAVFSRTFLWVTFEKKRARTS